jgi:hypothetical protein
MMSSGKMKHDSMCMDTLVLRILDFGAQVFTTKPHEPSPVVPVVCGK